MFPNSNQTNAAKGLNAFNFGAQTNTTTTPSFGTPITKSTFGGGASTSTFGAGGFSAQTDLTQGSSFMGFGNTTATAAPTLGAGFNFTGTPATGSVFGFSGFGGTNNVTSTGLGSVNMTLPTGMGLSSNFGSLNFGKPATTTAIATTTPSAFGNFNLGFGLQQPSTGFQATQQAAQQQQPQDPNDQLKRAIFNVNIYGDERDSTIAKFNYIQALWGTGKAYYSNNAPPIDITPDNYLCRFKTITYHVLEKQDNKDGYVLLVFNKTYDEIRNNQQQIIQNLSQIFDNRANITISINKIVEKDNKIYVTIYVDEKSFFNLNVSRRIPSTDISNYLNQMQYNMQLANIGIEYIIPVTMDKTDINKYLETGPKNIDPRMWNQAKLYNPNPDKFIPVPLYGLEALKKRIQMQDNEIEQQTKYMISIRHILSDIRQRHLRTVSRIEGLQRKVVVTKRNILEIIAKQECARKMFLPITMKDELIKNKIENINFTLQNRILFKGRLQEILVRTRLQLGRNLYNESNTIVPSLCIADEESENELHEFLTCELDMIKTLVHLVKSLIRIVNRIESNLPKLLFRQKLMIMK